jgi:hypothetical protein
VTSASATWSRISAWTHGFASLLIRRCLAGSLPDCRYAAFISDAARRGGDIAAVATARKLVILV